MNMLIQSPSAAAFLMITTGVFAQQLQQTQPVPTLATKSGPVHIERLATLDNPWGMTFLPDGRLLISEKPGRLRVYSDGKLSEPIRGVPKVVHRDQGGLLDVEIDPEFARNGFVYLYYTEAAGQQPKVERDDADPRLGPFHDATDVTLKGGAVARGKLDGAALTGVQVIWRQEPFTIGRNHYGGRLVFASDGKLFITSGDRQRFEPSQDLGSTVGKVVRINADGSIPPDNPFVKRQGARPDIWSVGHRNPLGAAIRPESNQLWIHEMGPAHGDELNPIEGGKNYGWPAVSNGDDYDGSVIPDHATQPKFAAPVYFWYPAVSPSGLIFYTGELFPKWRGNALLGALSGETLLRLTFQGKRVTGEERIAVARRIRDVIQAPDGAVLLLGDGNDADLLRLTPARR